MADGADDPSVHWVEPRLRAILPLDGFHLSRSLRKLLLADRFRVTTDTVFPAMMALCAEAADDRPTTWINPVIRASYERLFRMGHAHSVECWYDGELVGGLYGVSLGRAFFGESMVSRMRDASKIALAHLVARLRAGGFELPDCQLLTPPLASLGAIEMPQAAYLARLYSMRPWAPPRERPEPEYPRRHSRRATGRRSMPWAPIMPWARSARRVRRPDMSSHSF